MGKISIHFVINSLFLLSALRADDYYISYSLYVKDYIVINEKLSLSKAMVKFKREGKPICSFENNSSNIKSFFKENSSAILECLFKKEVLVHSNSLYFKNRRDRDYIKIDIPPTPIQVDFNDELVIIKEIR
jgi:hypothetical protein